MRLLKLLIIAILLPCHAFAAGITACGTLNSAGTTYVLQNNVTSNGTCFAISAANVTLDLNGNTVTYDNAAPIVVPNSSFESATMTDWDLTNAPQAARALGTYIGDTVSVYDGDYAIRFALPAANQYILSAANVTLAANTTYSLSAMFRNSGNNESAENSPGATRDPITLAISIDGTAYTATQTGITWRGFQYTNATFTTGGSPVSGKIRISIANATTSGVQGYVYVDDIKILKANSYGVDITGQAATVTNGTITQGQGNGFASHAINMSESFAGVGFDINNIVFTYQGINSKAVNGYYFRDATIFGNTINHNVATIKSRDNYDGASIYLQYSSSLGSYNSTIHDNTFNTGIQTAIYAAQTVGQTKNQIYNNEITLQSKYTNDFAIAASGSIVHDNTIHCGSGLNSCRGITSGGNGTVIYNNIVDVQQLERNQEYNGCEAFGAYGLQVEGPASNGQIYGNTVTANANTCEAHAFRANPNDDGAVSTNVSVHDNSFTALRSGTARATSIKLSEIEPDDLVFSKNTMTTNDEWIYLDGEGSVNQLFSCNTWVTAGTLDSPFYPFEVFTWADTHFTGTFHNNSYGTGDQARFADSVFRVQGAMTVDPDSSITLTTGAPYCVAAGDLSCSVLGGRYLSPQSIELTGTDLTIYYTTDGTTPTESSTQYSAAIPVLQNEALTTLKYFAKDAAGNSSAVQTQIYKCQRCK